MESAIASGNKKTEVAQQTSAAAVADAEKQKELAATTSAANQTAADAKLHLQKMNNAAPEAAAAVAAENTKKVATKTAAPQPKQDNRLYSFDQFFKPGTLASKCIGKRLFGRAIVISSEPDPKVEGKFIVILGETTRINGRNRDYFRILKTKSGKIVYARLFFKVRVSEETGMRVREGDVFSIKGRVGSYYEVVEGQYIPHRDNLYQGSDKIKFKDDYKFHGFYLFIPDGGTLTY